MKLHARQIEDWDNVPCATPPQCECGGAAHTQDDGVEAFRRLLGWLYAVPPQTGARRSEYDMLLARALAMAWVLRPDLIDHRTLGQIETETAGRLSRSWLHKLSRQFIRDFGLRPPQLRAGAGGGQAGAAAPRPANPPPPVRNLFPAKTRR